MQRALAFILFASSVGACCSAERTPEPEPVAHDEVVTEPHGPVAPVLAAEPQASCAIEPVAKCCEARSEECLACADRAQAERERWQARCGDNEPLPTSFDCQAPPPMKPCCRALLPRCTQCAERNRAIEEAYRAQCGPR